MRIIYFTGLHVTTFIYDKNLHFSSARPSSEIILENIARSKTSWRKWRKPYISLQWWQDLSHARWQQLLGYKPLHLTQISFALSTTICDRATVSQWPFHTLGLNPWKQQQEFSWKLSSTNTAFCCHSRYRASIFLAADKGWETYYNIYTLRQAEKIT